MCVKTRYNNLEDNERLVWDYYVEYARKTGFTKDGKKETNSSVYWLLKEVEREGFSDLLMAILGNGDKKASIINNNEDIDFEEITRAVEALDPDCKELNDSQKEAVSTALKKSVSFIQGPPGTGKSRTIINMIAHIAALNKTVAVVSSNNEAINTIERKLKEKEYSSLWEMTARLGNQKIMENDDNKNRYKEKGFVFDRNKVRKVRVGDNNYIEKKVYNVRAEDFTARDKYLVNLNTIHSLKRIFKDGDTFEYDYVIIDETSQTTIELGLLAASAAKHIVLVGDEEQLHAFYDEKNAKKIAENTDYRDITAEDETLCKYSLTNTSEGETVCDGKSFLGLMWSVFGNNPNVGYVFLNEHYRCHPGIIRFCKENVYCGEKYAGKNSLIIKTPGYKEGDEKIVPMRVIYYEGEYGERCVINNNYQTKHNIRQIELLKKIIKAKKGDHLYDGFREMIRDENYSIAFLTPFRGQAEDIKELLEKELKKINIEIQEEHFIESENSSEEQETEETINMNEMTSFVLTIHKSQGKEWDRVYFLPVDDGDWEKPWSQKKNMINVMVSRAKKELVIISSTGIMPRTIQEQLKLKGHVLPTYTDELKIYGELSNKDAADEHFLQTLFTYILDNSKYSKSNYGFISSKAHSIFDSKPMVNRYLQEIEDKEESTIKISAPELCMYDELGKYFGGSFQKSVKVDYQVPLFDLFKNKYEKDGIVDGNKIIVDEYLKRNTRKVNIGEQKREQLDELIKNEISSINKTREEINKIYNDLDAKLEELNKHDLGLAENTIGRRHNFTNIDKDFSLEDYIKNADYDFIVEKHDVVKAIIEVQGAPHRYVDTFDKERIADYELINDIEKRIYDRRDEIGPENVDSLNMIVRKMYELIRDLDEQIIEHTKTRDELKKYITYTIIPRSRYYTIHDDGRCITTNKNGEFDIMTLKEMVNKPSRDCPEYALDPNKAREDLRKLIEMHDSYTNFRNNFYNK